MSDRVVERIMVAWALSLIAAGVLAALMLAGCTTTAQSKALDTGTQTAVTALKIAACVQGALADEQLEALRQRREAEAAAAIEADRLNSEMHAPSSISQEVDKVVRDGGVM